MFSLGGLIPPLSTMLRCGVDPDVDGNGVAVYDKEKKTITLHNMGIDGIVRFCQEHRHQISEVVVEAGWHNKMTTWHTHYGDSVGVIAKKGYHVGRNHQRGIDIVEMLKPICNVTERTPFRKTWKGKDGKITHEELMALLASRQFGIRCDAKRSNQEQRDAALLAIF